MIHDRVSSLIEIEEGVCLQKTVGILLGCQIRTEVIISRVDLTNTFYLNYPKDISAGRQNDKEQSIGLGKSERNTMVACTGQLKI